MSATASSAESQTLPWCARRAAVELRERRAAVSCLARSWLMRDNMAAKVKEQGESPWSPHLYSDSAAILLASLSSSKIEMPKKNQNN